LKAEYINHMGDDLTVVNAARVSFDKESEWEVPPCWCGDVACQPTELKEGDGKLISFLARNNHWTPFSHCVVTLRETVPIFVARQRFKHMVGFSYNEVSRRYVDDQPEFFMPEKWRKKADNKKQGSSDEEVTVFGHTLFQGEISKYVQDHHDHSFYLYQGMLDSGVAPELARMVLPQSMYTSYYVTGSLAAWARAYSLRSKPDAQYEIRQLADQWSEVIKPLFPISWSALND
jgi:thymidylate synthase (FAD)